MAMLALSQRCRANDNCTPSILPCRIHHNGPIKVTKRYWSPSLEKDGTKTSYFRGRKLRGRIVKIPPGYQGIVAESCDQTLLATSSTPSKIAGVDESLDEDDEEESEPIKILQTASTFDELTVWGHDQLPAADDTFVKGVEEWIAFAEAINQPSAQITAEESSDNSPETLAPSS